MTPPRTADQDGSETRAQLLAATRDLLVEQGVGALSMRRVAGACGVSAPAIYRHFEDKDALVSAAAMQGFRIFGEYLLDGLEMDTPLGRFRRMARRYFDFAADHPRDYQLMFMTDCQQLGWEKLDAAVSRESSGTFRLLVDRIAECQQAGLFVAGDPMGLAVFAWSALHGVVSLSMQGNLPDDPQTVAQMQALQLRSIERGLALAPDSLPQDD